MRRKILRKTQKKIIKFLKSQKQYFFIKISFEIMSAFWRYMAIYYCVNFFLKGASRHIHSGKFIIQCPRCYLCCVCEEERRERNIGNPKKIIKPQKEYYFFFLNYLFSINVLSSANGDLYPVLTVIYIQC